MEEIDLLRSGQDKWTERNKVGIEGPNVAVAGLVAPPLALKVRKVAGSGGCHQLHRQFGGSGVFLSVGENINNMLHTNPNFKIVQDSTNSMYDIIVLQNNTNCRTNEKTPRNNLQKTDDI